MKKSSAIAAILVVIVIFAIVIIYTGTSQDQFISAQQQVSEAQTALDEATADGNVDEIAVATDALDLAQRTANAQVFGILTLLPPLLAILLAFLTQNVVVSLFLGVALGTFMVQLAMPSINVGVAFFEGFLDIVTGMINSMADSWNAGVILQVLCIGGVIALITKMGGAYAIAEALGKRAKSQRGSQFATWVMGIIIFFDDYANSLIVGSVMRPITDRTKVSREKLSFILDATAAPVAGIALISTWIATEMSAISTGFADMGASSITYGISTSQPYQWFLDSIPFRFYNILMLAFVVLTIVMLRDMGPMGRAQRRAYRDNTPLRPGSTPMASLDTEKEVMPDEKKKRSVWDAIIPLLILVVGSFVAFWYNGYALNVANGDPTDFMNCFSSADASVVLFQVALIASIVALLMGVIKKRFTIGEGITTWISGWKGLIITIIILLFAWTLNSTIQSLGTNIFLVNALADYIPYWFLPAGIFILGSLISFATGTSYGTMLILTPLTIPLANGVILANMAAIPDPTIYMIACIGAVLTGAIFGDHCSPISDTTILSSMGASVDHMDHVKTQMPYALLVAAVSVATGYMLVGFGANVYLCIAISIALLAVILFLFGQNLNGDRVFSRKKKAA